MSADRRDVWLAAVLAVVLAAGFAVMVALLTPWHPLPGADIHPAPLHRFFTPDQITRSNGFFAAARWPSWLGLLAQLAFAACLVFSTLGRRLVDVVRRRLRRWWLQVVALVIAVSVLGALVSLPFDVWGSVVAHDYGLSTESVGGWARDRLTSLGVTIVVASLVLLALIGLARRFTRRWFLPASAGAAALVVAVSFGYPVMIEPLFNSFTPLPPSVLRTQILALAHKDDIQVSDVLVADASRRTTAVNAYVSGFGATKRIVIYDTLLRSAPANEIELIVAHELGHAKRNDVVVGTLEGAVGTALAVTALYLAMRPRLLRRPAGAGSVGDPAIVPVFLGLVALVSFLVLPLENTVSRQIEARADAHSLQLTHDPRDFIAMQQRLAVTNLDHLTPNPVLAFWFDSHPTTLDRIGMGLAWERLHGRGRLITPPPTSGDWMHPHHRPAAARTRGPSTRPSATPGTGH
jgi:STE24 endopeptidase